MSIRKPETKTYQSFKALPNDGIKRVESIIWQVSHAILALGIIPLGIGLKFRTGQYILIGLYAWGIAGLLMLTALALRAIVWARENVSIK